ncbi:phosphate signaling complex protein PhoU [Frisingicoccus sp.]|uniref:phosphate signaling complex protein PhoU n=1 Tax=Frisingicoccus sp. TaxID=1918627 RepID=UPI0025B956DF|nr:phosphate signaling complex protein PhoU [Frisingicoccus sp.]MDY4923072.1 phosphate signaling complex protein PhoU [Frisingicoccus sp.]MDY5957536.1 phosphate signaling complex protein PhoU [Frisingicoccus sp.]
MRNRFDAQLELLHQKLIEMGNLCEQVISMTYKVLMDENHEAAKEIIEKDGHIDLIERDIESLCLKLLLQQQPVASDLRKVSAALKMITDMERIGDQAADIAEIIMTTNIKAPGLDVPIGRMAEATVRMVTDSVNAYVWQDLDTAQKVIEYDDVVDNLFDEVKEMLIREIDTNPMIHEHVMDILLIAKYYERIGDHATNISEWVEFSITGKHRGDEHL